MIKKIKKPILITGSTGFIGSNILRKFALNNIRTNILIRRNSDTWRINDILKRTNVYKVDLRDRKNLSKIIEKIKPKTIFHLSTYGAYSHQDNKNLIKENILDATINLLDECMKYKFNIFINTGSNSEYGFQNIKMKENIKPNPNSFYSVFKLASSQYCTFIAKRNKLNIINVRPFHIYGDFEDSSRLIPTLIRNMIKKEKIYLVDPKIKRDCLYIEDCVDAFLKLAINKHSSGDVYNLGSGSQKSIEQIFRTVSKELNYNISPKWSSMENRLWDQEKWLSDITKIKNNINWRPKTELKLGIKKTVKWYKKFFNDK